MPDFDGLNWKIVQCTLNNMTRPSKSAPSAIPALKQAVIYARVSSKEQEKEGFSIPAQLKLLKDYAANSGFAIAHEYVDVETAKQAGRPAFGVMVAYLKAHPSVRVMLVEKTDRLYRNLKDWVTIDELEVEIHFPKEGVVLSRDSRSSEKFMHGIKVLMAKNYIDNLSEETRKGMTEKAEQGLWPSNAPLGYRNVTGTDGRKTIVPDENIAPIIRTCSNGTLAGTFRFAKRRRRRGPLVWFSVRVAAVSRGAQSQGSCGIESIQADSTGMAKHIKGGTSPSFPPTFGSRFSMFWTGGPPAGQELENGTLPSRG